jgi:hypothetical protein
METTADQSATAADCEARLLEADQSVAVHGASVSDSRSRRRHSLPRTSEAACPTQVGMSIHCAPGGVQTAISGNF